MNLTQSELDLLVREDFFAFIETCFHELCNGEFHPNWHIQKIAEVLEACRTGKIRRLIINVPPRSLKSLCGSVAFPAWLLGHNPHTQVICASYSQDLAEKHARDCRSLMQTERYQRLFPTRLSSDKMAAAEFTTSEGGFRLATSVGGQLTGRGGDFIIIDDPLKPEEALSETERKNANEWFSSTVVSRLNDKRTGCIVVIMQRLHEDDLVGHILEMDDWTVIRFSAIAEEDETHVIRTPYKTYKVRRKAGEALHPEREPLDVLARIRASLGEYHFSGQYQQAPAPHGGGMIKIDWFLRYTEPEKPEKFEFVFQSWDTANKPSELSDYCVCTTWGFLKKKVYLLHLFRKKLNFPELKRAAEEQARFYQPGYILIEDKASGTQLIQELRHAGFSAVTSYEPKSDKIMRMDSASGMIENQFVYLPANAPWLPDLISELMAFPKGRYDDQCDSLSQALDWVKQKIYGYYDGVIEYYMRLAGRI
jgi:predicted phage terminase large subunit-like protein